MSPGNIQREVNHENYPQVYFLLQYNNEGILFLFFKVIYANTLKSHIMFRTSEQEVTNLRGVDAISQRENIFKNREGCSYLPILYIIRVTLGFSSLWVQILFYRIVSPDILGYNHVSIHDYLTWKQFHLEEFSPFS